jgi:thioredoxin-related protein
MKKTVFYFLFLLLPFLGKAQNWELDLEKAKSKAQKENKAVLIVFQGSDWCGPCMKLEEKVWKDETFNKQADKAYIMVQVDFPKSRKNKLSKEQSNRNEKVADKYKIEGFPTVIVLDSKGKEKGRFGYYPELSVKDYINNINLLIQQ